MARTFRGPWTRLEPTDVPSTQALLSLNCEYNQITAETRQGFKQFWNVGKALSSIINWIKIPDLQSTLGNYLFVYSLTDSKVQYVPDLTAPALNDAYSVTAEGISGVSYGQQFFLAAYTSGSIGAAQGRVFGNYPFTGPVVDKLFQGPISTVPTLANSGSGSNVTAGLHRVGYIITTRNGFAGKISPALSDGSFDTSSSITAPGGQAIDVTINPPTWPDDASFIQLVMTPASNPAAYYLVPYSTFAVVGGASFPINLTIDISDDDLITGIDVTNNQNLLTQDTLGAGPFNPFKLVSYGGRVVYFTYDANGYPVFYASEVDAGQQITEQYHKRGLPGFQQITTGFVLRSVLYVCGPNWTYSFEDTGGYPGTWPSATLIDGGVGSVSIDGAVVSPSGDFAVVAHTSGCYVFTGVYDKLPISYMVEPDWARINWAVAQTIRITVNPAKKQILVAVPLDGATSPSHLMMFDYTNGLTANTVMYSLWNLADSGYPRGLCVFQNPTTKKQETLISRGTAGKMLRQMNPTDDANPYRDDTSGVGGTTGSKYQTAPYPEGRIATVYKHLAEGVRILGNGNMQPTSYSEDNGIAVTWSNPIVMSSSPKKEYYRQFDLNAERCSTLFSISGVDKYFILSAIRHEYQDWALRR